MAGDIFDTVFAALTEQVPQMLTAAVRNTLDERGLYVASLIHEERVEIGDGTWLHTIYALQIDPPIAIAVFRFLAGGLPDDSKSLFCAPPHQLNSSIDVEITTAMQWARKAIRYE